MKDGGPAFPCNGIEDDPDFPGALQSVSYSGMSLRDWFAGMALNGLLASYANPNAIGFPTTAVVQDAYEQADAMLKEREK